MLFTTIIVKPIFNLLVLIYAELPGHNFGLALIIFTALIRLLMWPLLKKQLHQAKTMRQLQPEIKRIKKVSKGDRKEESRLMMELYKEKEINPFSTLPIMILQIVILLGLYSGLRRVIASASNIVSFAYPSLQHLAWMQTVAHNIHHFDDTLFGIVNLGRSAVDMHGNIYWPAMVIVLGSAVAQYFQSKQILPDSKEQRSLRTILKEAGNGKQADQGEVNAAVGRGTLFLLPLMIFLFTYNRASALSLYWLVGGIVAYIQQAIVLRSDEAEMETEADAKPSKNASEIPEAEVVGSTSTKPPKISKKAKRRKRA